jgi:hypothetical protein
MKINNGAMAQRHNGKKYYILSAISYLQFGASIVVLQDCTIARLHDCKTARQKTYLVTTIELSRDIFITSE